MTRVLKKPKIEEAPEPRPVKTKGERKKLNLSLNKKIKIALAVFVLFLVMNVAAMAAKTGMVNIPVFTQIFYRLPLPTRFIELEDPFQPNPEDLKVNGSKDESILNFVIGEKEMTFIARKALVQKSGKFAENLQVVVTPDFIEVYGLQLKPYKANITLKIRPKVVNEKFGVDIVEYKIGNLSVPPFLIQKLLGGFLSKSSPEAQKVLERFVEFKQVQLTEGCISLTAKVDMNFLLQMSAILSDNKKQ